ncbi:MAG: hypothetical protein ACLQO7_01340 [Candidatus Bathyarchaeia archaeon]
MQSIRPKQQEEKHRMCPHCKSGSLIRETKVYFSCSKCVSIYRDSPFNGLKRVNVDPVSDVSSYPEITLLAEPPYCDCELKEYLKTMMYNYGPKYCQKHNVISLGGTYEPKDLENIDKETKYVLLHETLHWVLGKFICESASFWLDNENVSEFIDDYLFDVQ